MTVLWRIRRATHATCCWSSTSSAAAPSLLWHWYRIVKQYDLPCCCVKSIKGTLWCCQLSTHATTLLLQDTCVRRHHGVPSVHSDELAADTQVWLGAAELAFTAAGESAWQGFAPIQATGCCVGALTLCMPPGLCRARITVPACWWLHAQHPFPQVLRLQPVFRCPGLLAFHTFWNLLAFHCCSQEPPACLDTLLLSCRGIKPCFRTSRSCQ